jgi:hypothetical protein
LFSINATKIVAKGEQACFYLKFKVENQKDVSKYRMYCVLENCTELEFAYALVIMQKKLFFIKKNTNNKIFQKNFKVI